MKWTRVVCFSKNIFVMAIGKLNADEKKWRAESDADTMARYEEIMADKSRRTAAIKAAQTRAADLSKRAAAMLRVGSTKSKTK